MSKIKVFLKEELKFSLSEAKTKITNANTEHAEFLSVRVKRSRHETYSILCPACSHGAKGGAIGGRRKVLSRNVKNMRLLAPIDKVTKKLISNGFLKEGRPYPKFI